MNVFKQHEILGLAYHSELDDVSSVTNVTNQIKNVINSDLVYINVKNYGAKGDGLTDDTLSFRAAVSEVKSHGGGTVFIPPGNYRINPVSYFYSATEGMRYGIELNCDNIYFLGTPYTTLKFMDNVSSDAVPLSMAFFASNAHRSNIAFDTIGFDFSDTTNPINGGAVNKFHAAVAFTGDYGRGDDISFLNCVFKNSAGCNVIVTSSGTTSSSYTMGKRWNLLFNKFYNLGTDTSDHSTIWGWADEMKIIGNNFIQPAMTHYHCAAELHGAGAVFSHNVISNYSQALWVAPNFTSAVENVIIQGNICNPLYAFGVRFYRAYDGEPQTNQAIRNIKIIDNHFVFTDEFAAVGVDIMCQQSIVNVEIRGNSIRKPSGSNYNARGVYLVCQRDTQKHDNIVVEDNFIEGMYRGVELYSDHISDDPLVLGGTVGSIAVNRNRIKNLRGNYPVGIRVHADHDDVKFYDVDIIGNKIINDEDPGNTNVGIAPVGYIEKLNMDGNDFDGLSSDIYLSALEYTGRCRGRQAHYTDKDFDTDDVLATGILNTVHGLVFVSETTGGVNAVYRIQVGTLVSVSADAAFSTTKDNAGTYNVYFESNVLNVQNKVGNNKFIKVRAENS